MVLKSCFHADMAATASAESVSEVKFSTSDHKKFVASKASEWKTRADVFARSLHTDAHSAGQPRPLLQTTFNLCPTGKSGAGSHGLQCQAPDRGDEQYALAITQSADLQATTINWYFRNIVGDPARGPVYQINVTIDGLSGSGGVIVADGNKCGPMSIMALRAAADQLCDAFHKHTRLASNRYHELNLSWFGVECTGGLVLCEPSDRHPTTSDFDDLLNALVPVLRVIINADADTQAAADGRLETFVRELSALRPCFL